VADADPASRAQARDREPADGSSPAVPREPDKTTRELDVGWGEAPHEADHRSDDDERLLRERPPHWEN